MKRNEFRSSDRKTINWDYGKTKARFKLKCSLKQSRTTKERRRRGRRKANLQNASFEKLLPIIEMWQFAFSKWSPFATVRWTWKLDRRRYRRFGRPQWAESVVVDRATKCVLTGTGPTKSRFTDRLCKSNSVTPVHFDRNSFWSTFEPTVVERGKNKLDQKFQILTNAICFTLRRPFGSCSSSCTFASNVFSSIVAFLI